MKKIALLFLTIALFSVDMLYAQRTEDKILTTKPLQGITLKPLNLLPTPFNWQDYRHFGQNDDSYGLRLGVAYERKMTASQHLSWEIPIDFYWNDFATADYGYKGFELYFAPGIRYHLNAKKPWKGFSISANALVGLEKFKSFNYYGPGGNGSGYPLGFSINSRYNISLGKQFSVGLNAGLGVARRKIHYRNIIPDAPTYYTKESISFPFYNFSIGVSKWF